MWHLQPQLSVCLGSEAEEKELSFLLSPPIGVAQYIRKHFIKTLTSFTSAGVSVVPPCCKHTVVSLPDPAFDCISPWSENPWRWETGRDPRKNFNSMTELLEIQLLIYSKSKAAKHRAILLSRKEGFPTNPFNQTQCGLSTKIPPLHRRAFSDYFPSKKYNLHIACLYFPNHSELGKGGKKHVCFYLKLSKLAFSN